MTGCAFREGFAAGMSKQAADEPRDVETCRHFPGCWAMTWGAQHGMEKLIPWVKPQSFATHSQG